jgi:hypothetical protein
LFRHAGNAKAIGESSPSYSERLSNPAPKRIAELLPGVRLIYMVRNPVVRVKSHWLQDLQSGFYEQRPFNEAVRTMSHYLDASLYWAHLNRYRDYFPESQILVLFQEELKADPNAMVKRCFSFLGIDPNVQLPHAERRVNVKEDIRTVTPSLKLARRMARMVLGRHKDKPQLRTWKSHVNKALGRQEPEALFDLETRQWYVERVREDASRLLTHYKKPADLWNFEVETKV